MQTMGRFDPEGWSYNFPRPTLFLLPLYPCLILYPCPSSFLSKHLKPLLLLLYLLHLPLSLSRFLSEMPVRRSSRRCKFNSPSPIETFDTGDTIRSPLLPTIILC